MYFSAQNLHLKCRATTYGLFLQLLAILATIGLASLVIVSYNKLLLVPLQLVRIYTNSLLDTLLSRSKLPIEWLVPNLETILLILRLDRNMRAKNVYSCIIEALAKLYQTAVYDYADVPVRADGYEQQKYGVFIEVSRYTKPESPILYYSTVVRTLQGLA